jgi:predicted small lipoprotein YifL
MRVPAILALLLITLTLTACGKKGPPSPAGPPDQITWPRVYPTH